MIRLNPGGRLWAKSVARRTTASHSSVKTNARSNVPDVLRLTEVFFVFICLFLFSFLVTLFSSLWLELLKDTVCKDTKSTQFLIGVWFRFQIVHDMIWCIFCF